MQNNLFKLSLGLLMAFSNLSWVSAQSKKQDHPWLRSAGIGVCAFQSNGLPPSQNEFNAHLVNGTSYTEEALIGFLYEAKIYRQLNSKNLLGLSAHGYKDSRFNDARPLMQNVEQIRIDSTSSDITTTTFQAYLNLGVDYQRKLAATANGNLSFNASLSAGLSINRTPERTEYNFFAKGFNDLDSSDLGLWQHVSTKFKHGFYLNPAINVEYKIGNNNGIRLEIGQVFQWHSAEKFCQIQNKNITGVRGGNTYTVSAQQLKLSYFF